MPSTMTTGNATTAGLWRGPAVISVGLVVLGLSSYAYLTVVAQLLDPLDYANVAALWSLVFFLLAGTFAPLEIEGTRAVSAAAASGRTVIHAVLPLARLATMWTLALVVGLAILHRPISALLFNDEAGYVLALAVVSVAFAVIYLGRGFLAGTRRFVAYSTILGGEGVLRALLVVAAAGVGLASALAAVGALALAAIVAAAGTAVVLGRAWTRQGAHVPAPSEPPSGGPKPVTRDLTALLVASLAAQGLVNAGPLTVQVLADDPALTGGVLAAFVLVRVPVMFISALQSGFIPTLVRELARGDMSGFDRMVAIVLSRVAAAGLVLVAGAAAIGPWATGLLFGPIYALEGLDYALLMLSSVVFVVAALMQAVLVSLQQQRLVAFGWVLGVVTYLACLVLPLDVLRRVELGSVVSMLVVTAFLWGGIHLTMRRRRSVHPDRPSGGPGFSPTGAT